jgi:hypothetical protein
MMQGYKTLAVGAGMVILPELLKYLSIFDWTTVLPAQYAPIASGLIMIAMRMLTTTPVGVKQ